MSAEIEKKIEQLGYLYDAWREMNVYEHTHNELITRVVKSYMAEAIVSISQELVEVYRAEFQVEKLSEA